MGTFDSNVTITKFGMGTVHIFSDSNASPSLSGNELFVYEQTVCAKEYKQGQTRSNKFDLDKQINIFTVHTNNNLNRQFVKKIISRKTSWTMHV